MFHVWRLDFWIFLARKVKKKLRKRVEDGSESPAEYVPGELLFFRRCACRKWLRKDMAKIEEMLRAAQDEEVKGKVKSKAVRAQKRQVGAPIASYTVLHFTFS